MKTSLSKSRYTKYCQCAKALWLSVNKPEEATVDAAVWRHALPRAMWWATLLWDSLATSWK